MGALAALTSRLMAMYGFWTTLLLVVASLGGVLAVLGACVFAAHRMTKVILPGEAVPSYFGISYVDVVNNRCVCHIIPVNLVVGAVQAFKARLKNGLNVKVGRKNP